jgi:hypothetical protein
MTPTREEFNRRTNPTVCESRNDEPEDEVAVRVSAAFRRVRKHLNELTLLVTVAAIVVYWLQLSVMRDQQAVMKAQVDEMRQEQRAWVYADVKPAAPITYDEHGMSVTVQFVFHNTGKLPATRVTPSFGVRVEDGQVANTWSEIQKMACQNAAPDSKPLIGHTVFPDQTAVVAYRHFTVPWSELNASNTTMLLVDFAGCILYETAGDPALRHTYFAYRPIDIRSGSAVSPQSGAVPVEDVAFVPIQFVAYDLD